MPLLETRSKRRYVRGGNRVVLFVVSLVEQYKEDKHRETCGKVHIQTYVVIERSSNSVKRESNKDGHKNCCIRMLPNVQ
jgi:hypothetical protein